MENRTLHAPYIEDFSRSIDLIPQFQIKAYKKSYNFSPIAMLYDDSILIDIIFTLDMENFQSKSELSELPCIFIFRSRHCNFWQFLLPIYTYIYLFIVHIYFIIFVCFSNVLQ